MCLVKAVVLPTRRLSTDEARPWWLARKRGRSVMSKAGWQVHIVDADGRIFHPEQFDEIFEIRSKASRFVTRPLI